jgi:hypothetical protein
LIACILDVERQDYPLAIVQIGHAACGMKIADRSHWRWEKISLRVGPRGVRCRGRSGMSSGSSTGVMSYGSRGVRTALLSINPVYRSADHH